jgi:ABC-2 type transport system permease protein
MNSVVNVLRQSAALGFSDWRVTQTWWSWLFGWLLRLLMQMAFFGMAAGLLGGVTSQRFVLIGNAVAVIILETSASALGAIADRMCGTVGLLVISPVRFIVVYLGRSAVVLVSACLTAVLALTLFPWLLGVPLPVHGVAVAAPAIVAVALTSYAFGVFLAAVLLRWVALTWLMINLGYFTVMTFGGVNVPLSVWPDWLRLLTHALPLRHGLEAIRACLDGEDLAGTLPLVVAELLVGAAWLALAWWSFERLVNSGRARGSLHFS